MRALNDDNGRLRQPPNAPYVLAAHALDDNEAGAAAPRIIFLQ